MLAKADAADLNRLEGVIERGIRSFVEVGSALRTIRDEDLYTDTHDTFEDYCRERWDMGRAHAYRQIDAAAMVETLSPIGDKVPTNEAQVRELVKAPEDKRVEVWETVVKESGEDNVTAKKVAEVRDRVVVAPSDEGEDPDEDEDDPDSRDDRYPWGSEDKWCWSLKNLYLQAPKRSRNAFRKWANENP